MNVLNNIDIYRCLNEETKKYLTCVFSWLDYLCENNITLKLKDDNDNIIDFNIEYKDDKIIIAFFLGALSFDNEIRDLFEANGIAIKDITKFAKKDIKYYDDATEAICFDELELPLLFNDIIGKLNYNAGISEEISVDEITPAFILDYILFKYDIDIIEDLLYSQIECNEHILSIPAFCDFQDYMAKLNKQYSKKHNTSKSDNNIKVITVGDFIITYDNGEAFLSLNNGQLYKEVDVMDNERHSIKIYDQARILRINDRYISKEVFDDFYESITNASIVGFTIQNPGFEESETFHCYKEDMFLSNEEENSLSNVPSTGALNRFGNDITNQPFIKNPAIGRDKELDELETILLYPEKDRSIIITGPGGSGKSSLIKGLCYRIQNGLINSKLKDIKIINLDITTCVAGTKYVGSLEEKLKSILDEAKGNKNIIICIEEMHRAMGAGKSEGDDNSVAQILKQYLDFGDVRIIGTTTDEEYDEYIEPDTAFKSRFEKVKISEPIDSVLFEIIHDLIEAYNNLEDTPTLKMDEAHKSILINLLIEATKKSCRHYQDRENNPRLLINIIKRAYAVANFENSDEVTLEHILNAYNSNPRIYDSSKKHYIEIIKNRLNCEPTPKGIILQFKPRN